jgi:hypothetical protein
MSKLREILDLLEETDAELEVLKSKLERANGMMDSGRRNDLWKSALSLAKDRTEKEIASAYKRLVKHYRSTGYVIV